MDLRPAELCDLWKLNKLCTEKSEVQYHFVRRNCRKTCEICFVDAHPHTTAITATKVQKTKPTSTTEVKTTVTTQEPTTTTQEPTTTSTQEPRTTTTQEPTTTTTQEPTTTTEEPTTTTQASTTRRRRTTRKYKPYTKGNTDFKI